MRRWWSKETIAVVTGGNRGIGFEICRQLADHGVTVILTSRDESVGVGWRSGAMIMEVWRRGIVWEKKDKKRILKNMGYTKHK